MPSEIRSYWLEVVTPAGTRADSLAGPVELGDLPCALVPDAGGGRVCIFVAYAPTTWFDWLPDGRRVDVRTDAYRIDVSPRTDEGPVSIRPPREPVALEGEIAAIIDGSWNRSGAASMDTLFTPRDQKPAISRILPTRDGRIWVRLHAPSESAMNPDGKEFWVETESRFDIFMPEGEHVGYVTGPAEMWIQDIRGDTVLATRVGDYGVPYIERLTVDWSDPN